MPSPNGIRKAGQDIFSANFADHLPGALKQDPKIKAIAEALTKEALTVSGEIENVLIYSRIDELPEALIDILAYDMHVDWYDYSFSLKVKRDTVKGSVKVHKKMGTAYATKTALEAVYPDSEIEEWFDYGGKPFYFRIRLNGDANDRINLKDIIEKVYMYKRLSAHLETICIEYRIFIVIQYRNKVRARVKAWPRQNVPVLYLDGMWKLDGSWKLCGYEKDESVDFYPVHAAGRIPFWVGCRGEAKEEAVIRLQVKASYIQFTQMVTEVYMRRPLKHLLLDGSWIMDGSHPLIHYDHANGGYYPLKTNSLSVARIKVNTSEAHVRIHSYLDGGWRLYGGRNLNGGIYEL